MPKTASLAIGPVITGESRSHARPRTKSGQFVAAVLDKRRCRTSGLRAQFGSSME